MISPNFKSVVYPTRGPIEIWKRAVRARKTRFNYMVVCKDVNGWYMSLAIVDWVRPGSYYIND